MHRERALKIYFRVTGLGVLLGFFYFMLTPWLLGLLGLRWRYAADQCMMILLTAGTILYLAGKAFCLFLPVKGQKGKTVLRILLGLFCLQLCLGMLVAGCMYLAAGYVPETVIQSEGRKYVKLGDEKTYPYGRLYAYYGPLLMGKEPENP